MYTRPPRDTIETPAAAWVAAASTRTSDTTSPRRSAMMTTILATRSTQARPLTPSRPRGPAPLPPVGTRRPIARCIVVARPSMSGRILVADNDAGMLDLLRHHLESDGHAVVAAGSGAEALAAVERDEVDVILTDLVMDEVDGLALLRAAQASQPGARVILMTAFGSLETAIEAMRQGAYDYLTKPFKLGEVSLAVQRAVEDRRLREENRRLRAQIEGRFGLDAL